MGRSVANSPKKVQVFVLFYFVLRDIFVKSLFLSDFRQLFINFFNLL